jgi:hypothetical protein
MNFTLETIKLLSLSRSIPKETLFNCKKGIWIAFLSREIDKRGTEMAIRATSKNGQYLTFSAREHMDYISETKIFYVCPWFTLMEHRGIAQAC